MAMPTTTPVPSVHDVIFRIMYKRREYTVKWNVKYALRGAGRPTEYSVVIRHEKKDSVGHVHLWTGRPPTMDHARFLIVKHADDVLSAHKEKSGILRVQGVA